jgi:segregation and condensation protein A
VSLAALQLDLDLFTGPFDLLLALVLREEVDLLELPLAEVVLAYLDHLEQRDELELESATEFIVLIAALLELKSSMMLRGEDDQEPLELEPEQAAEELLARMLDVQRFRAAAAHLGELLAAEDGVRFRCAPLPAGLRRHLVAPPEGSQDAAVLGEAIGSLLRMPPRLDLRHVAVPRVPFAERLAHLRQLLSRGSFGFDEAVGDGDRMTVAVTLFALLELYKRGEAIWRQERNFGEISIHPAAAAESAGSAGIAGADRAHRAAAGAVAGQNGVAGGNAAGDGNPAPAGGAALAGWRPRDSA